MDIDNVTSELRGFVRERFGIPENDSDFNDEVNLFNYGYIDSFGAVELTSFIESQFSVRLTESDWASFPLDTIREISSFVAKRQKGEI
jgi:acyl carrier protein